MKQHKKCDPQSWLTLGEEKGWGTVMCFPWSLLSQKGEVFFCFSFNIHQVGLHSADFQIALVLSYTSKPSSDRSY